MNLYLLLITLTTVNAGVVTDIERNRVIFDGKYYDKEILKNLSFPYNLAVDYSANIMYFSYYNGTNGKSALIDLNTKVFKDINDVPVGRTQAVDQKTHDIYIGGHNGISKYDPKNHKSEVYYAANDKYLYILRVFFKDVLYFCEWPSYFTYTYIDGNIEKIHNFEDIKSFQFVIDGEDVMFYFNKTGFYGQKKGSKDAVLYSDKDVNALTVDVHGNAYMCDKDAIYKIDKKSSSLEKKMDVCECFGLAFDGNDNVIYSTSESLIYLKNNKDKACSIFSPLVVLMLGLSHLGL